MKLTQQLYALNQQIINQEKLKLQVAALKEQVDAKTSITDSLLARNREISQKYTTLKEKCHELLGIINFYQQQQPEGLPSGHGCMEHLASPVLQDNLRSLKLDQVGSDEKPLDHVVDDAVSLNGTLNATSSVPSTPSVLPTRSKRRRGRPNKDTADVAVPMPTSPPVSSLSNTPLPAVPRNNEPTTLFSHNAVLDCYSFLMLDERAACSMPEIITVEDSLLASSFGSARTS